MMTTMPTLIENVIKCFVRRRRRSRLINSPAREGRREGSRDREAGARRLTRRPTNTRRCEAACTCSTRNSTKFPSTPQQPSRPTAVCTFDKMTPQKFFFSVRQFFLFKWAIFLCKDNCPLSEGCFDCHPYRDNGTTVRVRACAKKVLSYTQTNDGETLAVQILANKCGTASSSSRSWKVGSQVGLLSPCPNQVFNTSSILKDSMLSSPRFLLSIVSSLSLKFSTLMTLLVLG